MEKLTKTEKVTIKLLVASEKRAIEAEAEEVRRKYEQYKKDNNTAKQQIYFERLVILQNDFEMLTNLLDKLKRASI